MIKSVVGRDLRMAALLLSFVFVAIPLYAPQAEAANAVIYKDFGNSVKIGFIGENGENEELKALPPARRIAIWPGESGELHMAEQFIASGQFDVSTPSKVGGIATAAQISRDLKELTRGEQAEAFDLVCRETGTELVFATHNLGTGKSEGLFSITYTTRVDLVAFSCAEHSFVWETHMALVQRPITRAASEDQLQSAAGDAWAERVISAKNLGVQQVSSN
ncbi:hypothetical protein A3H77_00390 [Candidatus Kaiserbacteria bacterium RIFCSPLOWO2_02_FULL_56_11]|nr:MAG: hypothetical protein A3H77_00390 [Candidatus Kaiserbacteria bacterium RIFCSPLOWO2_02_FULL_56_11]